MRFSELLTSAGLKTSAEHGDVDVADVRCDSRACGSGTCFVAVRGCHADGHRFIASAVAAGASAVVCEDVSAVPPGVPCAVVDDTAAALGPLAQAILDWPSRELTNIAVTGTNGKSTTAFLIRSILQQAGYAPAMLGTISYETGLRSLPAGTTTPDAVALADMTAEMVAAGKTHLVMEASSHALDQHRTGGLRFAVGVFTNLTGDHLDYHKTMEQYLAAKRRLFEGLDASATAVINRDDPAGDALADATQAKVLWYGLNASADLWTRIDRIDVTGCGFRLTNDAAAVDVAMPLIGRHNIYNALGAAGACRALGLELDAIAAALANAPQVPGRLQRVVGDAPFEVFVDYAHTDDALANVLGALRPITAGRILVVFGCGGDRDRTKRPRMAKVTEGQADRIIVTSDNPRSEDPAAIIEEIVAGFDASAAGRYDVQPDRAAAIETALKQAHPGDVVLIAGKGHENYQIIGDRRTHFDDVETAANLLKKGMFST